MNVDCQQRCAMFTVIKHRPDNLILFHSAVLTRASDPSELTLFHVRSQYSSRFTYCPVSGALNTIALNGRNAMIIFEKMYSSYFLM